MFFFVSKVICFRVLAGVCLCVVSGLIGVKEIGERDENAEKRGFMIKWFYN